MANRYPYKEPPLQQQAGMIQSNVPGFSGRNMWPQQQQLQLQPQLQQSEEQRQREYLKQQQKLRLMSAGLRKQPVSADKLIENLLEKEDTFRPRGSLQTISPAPISAHQIHGRLTTGAAAVGYPQSCPSYGAMPRSGTDVKPGVPQTSNECFSELKVTPQSNMSKSQSQMPSWLSSGSPNLPAVYRQVWKFSGTDKGFVDTSKILPVLLTSGLPTDVLGYIWGLANQKVAGQLTEEELYIVLALIALAQSGCAFNNVSILGVLPQPPIPTLNFNAVGMTVMQGKEASGLQPAKNYEEEINAQILPYTTVESADDFSDFQSAVFEATTTANTTTALITSTTTSLSAVATNAVDPAGTASKENLSPVVDCSFLNTEPKDLPDVSSNQKFPSVLVMSNSGRGIGSRLANHSLGTPRQAKARHHKHHHHHHHHHRSHQLPQPTISSTPVEDEFSDFQQAKNSENGDTLDTPELFAKCVTKPMQSKTFVLKESAIRIEKRSDDGQQVTLPEAQVSKLQKPVSMDSLQLENPNYGEVNKELMSVEEDKYSALRALSFATEEGDQSPSDDFGDFLSAEMPPVAEVSKENISGIQVPAVQDSVWPSNNSNGLQNVEFNVDDWGSFESAETLSAKNIETNKNSSEIAPKVPLNKVGSDITSDSFSWDFNLAVTQTTKDIENVKLSDRNLESGEKDSGLSFLGKIYDKPTLQSNGNIDLLVSETEPAVGNNPLVMENKDDDFGDFIGSETWSTDGKYNKDILFDNQPGIGIKESAFDNQSVSSLELPPLALSRHGSLPSLDLKIFPQNGEKTSGHQAWDSSSQGTEHQIHEWCRCVQGCLELLQAALTTFNSVSSDEVLREVVNARKGRDYLANLLEVYGICQRVRGSANNMLADSKQLETLFIAVCTTWSSLEQFYAKGDIAIERGDIGSSAAETQVSSADNCERYICGICLNRIGSDLMDPCHLEYGGQVYHAACANLWVNCVDCSLPSLTLL